MKIFSYADETEFRKSGTTSSAMVGCGLFLSEKELGQNIIDEALLNLSKDSRRNKNDQRTLNRGYFHASEDSNTSHKHLCESIKKHVSGTFHYHYFENGTKEKNNGKKLFLEENIRLTLGISILEFFNNKFDGVNLIIENRKGFSKEFAIQWLEKWSNDVEWHVCKSPTFLTYFTNIDILTDKKINPGLQIIDFILWAFIRGEKQPPDGSWKTELNLKLLSHSNDELKIDNGGRYYLGRPIKDNSPLNYPFKIEGLDTVEELISAYMEIESTVRQLFLHQLPDHVSHFKNKLTFIGRKLFLDEYTMTINFLRQTCSLYIRIFDTLPVYGHLEDDDYENWRKTLMAKRAASVFIDIRQIHSKRSCSYICNWRAQIQIEQPTLLQQIGVYKFTQIRSN
ncbi:MAG TPA: hypothetical protein VK563_07155 [Puia sp.]|nr:hypothetical protein [Puia sp.]